jgi:hypothetical protein
MHPTALADVVEQLRSKPSVSTETTKEDKDCTTTPTN